MLHIVFEYKDAYTNGKWNQQECYVSSVNKCIEIYGLLEPDVECNFIKIEDVNAGGNSDDE